MSRYQVTPNMLIVPPQLLLYLATAPEEKIKYTEGGERAVSNFEAGMQGYETRAFRGLGVFVSMPYGSHSPLQPAARAPRSPFALAREQRCRTTRTRSRCSSARARWASSTA